MINRCIGCYYHDSKENVCTHGSPIFLDDTCTDYQDNDFVKQIKAEVINNFAVNAITEFQKFDKEHGYPTLADISVILSDVAEQLKEQNK